MHRPAKLVIAGFLAVLGASVHAGYAQLAPPVGFSGTPGGWQFAPSANDQSFGRVVHQPNGLKVPVPGATTTMPASYRWASNAPRVAAGFLFLSPQVRTAVNIAAWLITAKLVYDEAQKIWREKADPQGGDGFEYQSSIDPQGTWFSTVDGACQRALSIYASTAGNGYTVSLAECAYPSMSYNVKGPWDTVTRSTSINRRASTSPGECPAGWQSTPAGCLSPALQQPEFVEKLGPKPMPERVPFELPYPSPLPIEHPSPFINPAPGPDPAHRPRFVPSGDPVPNPNYDPQAQPSPENEPYIQPGTRIKPSPTPDNPWRVEIEPVNIPTPSPEPQPEIDDPSPEIKPKPEDQQSLCEKHPDIVACEKLGTAPEIKPVPNEDKTLEITKDTGWGPETGTCPAPKTATVQGITVALEFDLLCQFADGIRPVVIGLAWLSAVVGFMGLGRKD